MEPDYILNRLKTTITKFNNSSYSTSDFHSTIESIILSVTESDLYDLKIKLEKLENELEYIDHMVNGELRKGEYIKKIEIFIVDVELF